MNRELVRALNQLASLTAQCSFDDVDRPVRAKAPSPIERCRRTKMARRRSRYRNRHQPRKP
jgi:hypothetical protein